MQHSSLENGRWAELSFPQQMANIGSETSRVLKALEAGKESRAMSAFARFQELIDLTIRYGRLNESPNLPLRTGIWTNLLPCDSYSFFSSTAGLVFAAFNVCQRTEMRLNTMVMATASTKIHQ